MIYGFNEKKEKVAISEEGYQFVEKDNDGNVDITGDLDVGGDVSVGGSITATLVNGKNTSKWLTGSAFEVEHYTIPSVSVAANTDSGAKNYSIEKDGWYPLGIVGFNVTGTNRMYQNLYECTLANQGEANVKVIWRFRNNANVAVSIGLNVDVLWMKVL